MYWDVRMLGIEVLLDVQRNESSLLYVYREMKGKWMVDC